MKSQAWGGLDNLEGLGKPLPDRFESALVDPGIAAGFRIMAAAGVVPEEITLKKQADARRAHLATLVDPVECKAAMAVLADLEMRHAMAADARRNFLG